MSAPQSNTPIAIIGMSMNFPESGTSATAFWDMLCKGRNVSTKIPKERFNVDAFRHPDTSKHYSMNADGGHFIETPLDCFDAPFFSIGLAEAACMDPQQRLLLETSFHALENAGITIPSCAGSETAVYTGSFMDDYKSVMYADPELERRYAASGLATNMIANRISWFYDFRGPSVNLDTACSSSLTALHACCQDLRLGIVNMGLVGGCSLVFGPDNFYTMTSMNFLSPDNRSHSFDESANGYSRGEGFGMVVVKRLDDAIRDGDTVRAIIRATGIGQDGRTPGITVPSGSSQRSLIEKTYSQAGISMEPTRYCEAHATGTPVGDPIEANAIGEAFAKYRTESAPMFLGSVKANVGHMEAASGLASLIKTVLILESGVIPPVAGLENINSKIKAQQYHLHFPTQSVPWPSQGLRRICINSFGFGGSNAVAVLDDASSGQCDSRRILHRTCHSLSGAERPTSSGQVEVPAVESKIERLMCLSALDEVSLKNNLADLRAHLQPEAPWTTSQFLDIVYTCSARRTVFPWRCSFTTSLNVPSDMAPVIADMPVSSSKPRSCMFVFTGQGSQYEKMGQQLFERSAFRQSVAKSSEYLCGLGFPHSIEAILRGEVDDISINDSQNSQPLLTALQIALVDLLKIYNLLPAVVVGHSSGEIAAAYCAGHITREEALRVAFYRGQVVSGLNNSSPVSYGMMAVGISAAEAEEIINQNCSGDKPQIVVACCNSPTNTTLSGLESGLIDTERVLASKKIFHKRLTVRIPYHSHFLASLAEDYLQRMGQFSQCSPQDPKSPIMISSITGQPVYAEATADPQYWVRNMVSPVKFSDALRYATETLAKKKRKRLGHVYIPQVTIDDILEVGPHATLRSAIQECLENQGQAVKPSYLSCLRRGTPASSAFLQTIGHLFTRGYALDLLAVNELSMQPRPLAIDLPPYSFNHSQTHWIESRISKAYRFRKFPRQDFLGVRNPDWNPREARWRHQISISSDPWVKDHRINGEVLYPGAGWIVMALEASKQLTPLDDVIVGYRLQDVRFLNPLGVAEDRSHECSITLRTIASSNMLTAYEFVVYTYGDDSTTELCAGRISVVKDADSSHVLSQANVQRLSEESDEAFSAPVDEFSGREIYDEILPGNGATYGPVFQVLQHIKVASGGRTSATLDTRTWMSDQKTTQPTSFVIHPALLDSLFHVIFPYFLSTENPNNAALPSKVGHIWISNKLNGNGVSATLRAGGEVKPRGFRGVEGTVVVTAPGETEVLMAMERAELTFLRSVNTMASSDERHLVSEMVWAPYIPSMSPSQLTQHCQQPTSNVSGNPERMRDLNLVAHHFIQELSEQGDIIFHEARPWLKNYISWAKARFQDRSTCEIDLKKLDELKHNPKQRELFLHEVETSSHQGALLVSVGKQLRQILKGEVDLLNLIFRGKLGQDFYSEALESDALVSGLKSFLELLTHHNPALKILEVGAGTGSCTSLILDVFRERGYPSFASYHFTDISSAFFPAARARFSDLADRMKFSVFDVEADISLQDLDGATHDLVIAGNVLHATQDLEDVLRRVKDLLKPGGYLVLFEITNPLSVRAPFAMGLLEGWWRKHDAAERLSPCLTPLEWDCALKNAGFEGVILEISDGLAGSLHENSFLIARAPILERPIYSGPYAWTVLLDGAVEAQKALGAEISRKLTSRGTRCSELSLKALMQGTEICNTDNIMFLLDVDSPFLVSLASETFEALKRILTTAHNILWVTCPRSRASASDTRLVDGLARCLRSENIRLNFVVAHLEEKSSEQMRHLDTIMSHMIDNDLAEMEHEFRVHNDQIEISRVVPSTLLDRGLTERLSSTLEKTVDVNSPACLELKIGTYGQPHTLYYSEKDDVSSKVKQDDLIVRSKAFGFTHRDYLVAVGQLNECELCFAAAGVVEKSGSRPDGFEVDDRVCVVGPEVCQTLLVCNATQIATIPDTMSYAEAASMAIPAMLAVHALIDISRLEAGDSLLVHHANGAVGQLCLQLALHLGVELYVTVGNEAKKSFLASNYHIPEDHILNPRNFHQQISLLTDGRGVTAIINYLDTTAETSMQFLAHNGIFVDLNLVSKTGSNDFNLVLHARNKNSMYAKVNLADLWRNQPAKAARLFQKAWCMVKEGILIPPKSISTAEIGNEAELILRYGDPEHIGPSVVTIEDYSTVKALVRNDAAHMLSADATYVIAGAFGGLGRVITRWMVDRGARYLVLLSRSGLSSAHAANFSEELQALGVKVYAPACDISSPSAVAEAFEHCKKSMPEIRGCVQSSVVYRDSIFENMNFSDWKACLAPKVSGSSNLTAALPPHLDLLIFISSVSGIQGSRSQANYAAANAYMDALARQLATNGTQPRATSLDLGMMIEDGYVAETEGMLEKLRKIGHWMDLTQKDFRGLMDYFCDPRREISKEKDSQAIIGLELPARMISQGVDLPISMSRPQFGHFYNITPVGQIEKNLQQALSPKNNAFKTLLERTSSIEEAMEIIHSALEIKLGTVLGLAQLKLETTSPLHTVGVDSLMGIELRTWLDVEMGAEMQTFEILGDNSVGQITGVVAQRSRFRKV